MSEADNAEVRGRLQYVRIPLDDDRRHVVTINLAAHPIDPAVVVMAADPDAPNPILAALHTTPPARSVELVIRVDFDLPESITCPKCGMTTTNPTDIAEGYCGNCHEWTSPKVTPL